jgi:hypothetical protein
MLGFFSGALTMVRRPFQVTESMIEEIDQQIDQALSQPRLPLLETREQTHGSFEQNAIVSQTLKSSFRMVPGWHKLTEVERECLDMIAVKFSRILSGRSLEKQHWEDVVGYANLALEKCV